MDLPAFCCIWLFGKDIYCGVEPKSEVRWKVPKGPQTYRSEGCVRVSILGSVTMDSGRDLVLGYFDPYGESSEVL